MATPCRQKNIASQSQIKLLARSSLTEAHKRVFVRNSKKLFVHHLLVIINYKNAGMFVVACNQKLRFIDRQEYIFL